MANVTCSVEDCDRAVRARGWCMKHYQRWNKYGSTDLPTVTPEERFWAKVDRGPGCWEWTANRDRDGYGVFKFDGKNRRAHTMAWKFTRGEVPEGLVPDHLCRNRACVNPDHLEWVTDRENILRGEGIAARNARKTHCKRGHEFTEENTYLVKRGRACIQCERDRWRKP